MLRRLRAYQASLGGEAQFAGTPGTTLDPKGAPMLRILSYLPERALYQNPLQCGCGESKTWEKRIHGPRSANPSHWVFGEIINPNPP